MKKTFALTALILGIFVGSGNIGTSNAQAELTAYHLRVLQTAYCLRGTTATGTSVHYGTVAVDPDVIRLGSYIAVPGYGRGHAEDTGAYINGYHIDVWVPSCSKAIHMGKKYLTITVYR